MIQSRLHFRDSLSDLICGGAKNLSDLSGCTRSIAGRLKPKTTADIIRIVKMARQHQAKLHPISCGRNWGFGSALPYEDDAWILDLGALAEITAYDEECGSISIQPGVTQGKLYHFLSIREDKWFFNITGAGESTSVLGNALERGIGYYGQRHLDLVELQVVTGTGDVVWSHLGTGDDSGAALGTDITQLFCQGSMGVVIGARLRLIPRTDGGGVVIARLKNAAQAGEFFRRILHLKREGCIAGVPHIGNRERIVTTMAPWLPSAHAASLAERSAAWTAALPLLGRRELVVAAADIIQECLGELADLEVLTGNGDHEDFDSATSPLEQLKQLACGYPSNLALPGVQWSALGRADLAVADPETTTAGLIHVTPALRSSAADIQQTVAQVEREAEAIGLPPLALTVNVVDSLTAVMIISIPFLQGNAEAAHRQAKKLEAALCKSGLGFYRRGLMPTEDSTNAPLPARRLFSRLRRAMDPRGVFAPSKYEMKYRQPPRVKQSRSSRHSKQSPLLPKS